MQQVYFKIKKEKYSFDYFLYIRDSYGLTFIGKYMDKKPMARHIRRIQNLYKIGFSL